MTNVQGWSPSEKYEKEVLNRNKLLSKYEATKNKETKTAIWMLEKIKKSEYEIAKLEPYKNDIVLSDTCITYLEDWIKREYYWRDKHYRNDALDKWTECETEAIYVLNKALWTNYKKSVYNNWDKMENDWCIWHEDIDWGDFTIDTKVSLSFDSFPILKEDFEKNYRRQGQWYMRLKWDSYKKHIVAKVLVNSPEWLVKNKMYIEYMNLSKKYEWMEEYFEEEFIANVRKIFKSHVFDQQLQVNNNWILMRLELDEVIPRDKRVKTYEFERDNEAIEKIKKRVEECRIYLKSKWF